jgi:2,3,4,5-tetrahydropyridine-2-carboxylate N-succinyltransferase
VRAGADPDALREAVEQLAALEEPPRDETVEVVAALLDALEAGAIRAARPTPQGWEVNVWVKRGILLGFRIGANREVAVDPVFHFRDRDTFPTRNPAAGGRDVRVVPGGTTIRRGAFVGEGVVVMPPAYVNVGAWVGEASMVDSHALVGSCAQLGARVHLSAAAQIGGVLEPIGALPVPYTTWRGARSCAPPGTDRWSFRRTPWWFPVRARRGARSRNVTDSTSTRR